jgi:hypothetical protein
MDESLGIVGDILAEKMMGVLKDKNEEHWLKEFGAPLQI